MREYVCAVCDGAGTVGFFGLIRKKCPACEDRRKQEERILAKKIIKGITFRECTTVIPRLVLDKQMWICKSNVLQEGFCVGIIIGEGESPTDAYASWNNDRTILRIQIK